MKKKILVVAGLIVAAFAVTGCGSNSGSNSSSKEIEFFSAKPENADTMKELVNKFNEQNSGDGVKVVLNTPADAGTVLKTRLAKNDVPDVMALGGDNYYTEVESTGTLADLSNESYMKNVQDAYLQMVYDVQKDKEKTAYAVPYATNASGVLYNVDKFNELGLEVPKTWDEFMDVIKKIEDAGEQPFLFTFKDSWTCLPAWNTMAPDLQPDGFMEDRKENKTTFADTHQEIAQKYLELIAHGQKDIMGTTYDDGNKAFANGEAVMMMNGSWAISQFMAANADFNVNMFALPASNDESKNYVTSGVDVLFCANKNSKNLDLAKKFIAFMMEEENAKTYIDEQFTFSAIKGVEQTDNKVSGVEEDIANGKVSNYPDHYYPSGFDLSSLLSEFCLNYVNGMDDDKNISEFLKNCDEKYDATNID